MALNYIHSKARIWRMIRLPLLVPPPTKEQGAMDYTKQLDQAIDRLHEEGRYRTFIDIDA